MKIEKEIYSANVIRAGKKDDEVQDLYKAKDYIEREIQHVKQLRSKEDKKWTE